jgi:hypothetical protein
MARGGGNSHATPIYTPLNHDDEINMDASDVRSEILLAGDNEELNKSTLKKLDFILLPFLALLFLFNSLDRSNVSSSPLLP